ncbi:hypothetical protein V5E97_28855 [Singulisphaera sp. Ch08]|uniref:Uncharacterized protein n=1 Tax=Singulisphaera sp. Ch08 TaxID=3120278 RepID=A0AAU7CAH4_9BACT
MQGNPLRGTSLCAARPANRVVGEIAEGSVNIVKKLKQAKLGATDFGEVWKEVLPGISLAWLSADDIDGRFGQVFGHVDQPAMVGL